MKWMAKFTRLDKIPNAELVGLMAFLKPEEGDFNLGEIVERLKRLAKESGNERLRLNERSVSSMIFSNESQFKNTGAESYRSKFTPSGREEYERMFNGHDEKTREELKKAAEKVWEYSIEEF